jgi:hypothetical protein
VLAGLIHLGDAIHFKGLAISVQYAGKPKAAKIVPITNFTSQFLFAH